MGMTEAKLQHVRGKDNGASHDPDSERGGATSSRLFRLPIRNQREESTQEARGIQTKQGWGPQPLHQQERLQSLIKDVKHQEHIWFASRASDATDTSRNIVILGDADIPMTLLQTSFFRQADAGRHTSSRLYPGDIGPVCCLWERYIL